jgi:hypothetical protein
MSTPVHSTAASLRVFLGKMIDYAGLFPPASLDMMTSVSNYSRYLNAEQGWALGRFALPVSRLDEFLNAQENAVSDPWRLSGILSGDFESELAMVDELNRKAPSAVIESVEVRVRDLDEVDLVHRKQPPHTTVFFEFAPQQADSFLPILSHVGGYAKLRMGGVVEQAFPGVEQTVECIARCAELGVPFKATAGLHHPWRSISPLTYEPNSPKGWMHGFLNLFTAAAIAWSAVRSDRAVPRTSLANCLADCDRANWHFDDDALTWSGEEDPIKMDIECLRSMRSRFALSFGSCSFEEPLQELRGLDLL